MSRARMGLLALPLAAAMVFAAPTIATAGNEKPSCCQVPQDESKQQVPQSPQWQTQQDAEQSEPEDAGFHEDIERIGALALELNEMAAEGTTDTALVLKLEELLTLFKNTNQPADKIAGIEQLSEDSKLLATQEQGEESDGKGQKQKDIAQKASKFASSVKANTLPKKISAGGL